MSDSDSDTELLASLLATAEDDRDDKQSKDVVSQQLKFDQEHDSDDDLLATLVGEEDEDDNSKTAASSDSSTRPKANALKELDFNFLDDISDDVAEKAAMPSAPLKGKKLSAPTEEDNAANSSEDEDKYPKAQQYYSDYGRDIKRMMKTQKSEEENCSSSLRSNNSYTSPAARQNSSNLSKSFKSKVTTSSPSLSNSSNGLSEKSNKYSLQAGGTSETPNSQKKDVYSDPIFGLRIVKPLVSSAELVERMQGRKPVTVSGVKMHLLNMSAASTEEDWVIAGVLINKSPTKTSAKGSQFCIWKISDLGTEMNAVALFLFSGAYKKLWKLPTGTVIGILNPSVLEKRDGCTDLASLSVDNEHRVMILGVSRDLGKCKSVKKNGEPCSNPVNLRVCEYCVYHVKQEYGKFSKRSDLQAHGLSNTIGRLGKSPANQPKQSTSIYQQLRPDSKSFVAIPAKRDEKQYKKDRERLALLKADPKALLKKSKEQEVKPASPGGFNPSQMKLTSADTSAQQMRKDLERLNKLRGWGSNSFSPTSSQEKPEVRLLLSTPRLGSGQKNGIIDFSEPIPKSSVNKAKLNAIEYIKKNGAIKKTNPNRIRPSKEDLTERGLKRKREETESETKAEKEEAVKSKFQEMLEMKSAHADLIENHENEETDKYFQAQLAKERMEEKMLTTFKVNCKAVYCRVCKYTAFSSSDFCKSLQHPIKVFDAIKRFFKCGNCGNRTVSLDKIPTETCSRCASSNWVKTTMMDEKRTQLPNTKLSIRGGEESYIGADMSIDNLDLLVP